MIVRNYLCHRVGQFDKESWPFLSTSLFEKVIKYIIRHNDVVPLEDFYLKRIKKYHKGPIACITFDDGFKDNVEIAVPILKKYHCPASFYVVTDCVDGNRPPWFWQIRYLFKRTGKLSLDMDMDILPDYLKFNKWGRPEERIKYSETFIKFLVNADDALRKRLTKDVVSNFDDVPMPKNMMMTWEDLKKLKRDGFTIGSHGRSHALLGHINDKDILVDEINGSAKIIERMLGECPLSISYPRNSYNETVINICKQANYKLGLTVGQRFYNSLTDNLFEIPRVDFYSGEGGWVRTWMRINRYSENIKAMSHFTGFYLSSRKNHA